MSDSEILDKYVALDKSWFTDTEKKQVMDTFIQIQRTFSLRDEIVTCPNIEI